jgi:hypothetical protein
VQAFPPTQAYPQQPPTQFGGPGTPGGPGGPGGLGAPGAAPEKSKTPWIIAGVVAAVAAVVVGVLALAGGDDSKTDTLGGGTQDSSVDSTLFTLPPTTQAATDDTFVITAPESTAPPSTVVDPATTVSADDVVSVTDDTNTFSIFLPGSFQTDTAPLDAQGVQFAQISGSEDLQAYVNDHDTFGITVLGAQADQVAAPADLVNIFDPGADVCTSRTPQSGYATSLGTAEVLLLDGCGTGGAFAKVIMAVPVPAQNAMVIAVAQGPGPANASLLSFAQAVVESVTPV